MVLSNQCDESKMGANGPDDDKVLYDELCLMQVLLISKCCHSFQHNFVD